jgi:phosphatidylserine/phosphatidylglycerophosphate/cardiolipin synthase-like enzyme
VYVASGEYYRNSLALIGSFNLTVSGLHENIEMGLLLTGAEVVDRELIQKMELKLTQIATNGRKVSGNEYTN